MSKQLQSIANSIKNAKPAKTKKNEFLPEDCPVTPLGTKKGTYYYIDALGQFRELKDKEHTRTILLGLLGSRLHFIETEYGKYSESGELTGWKPDNFGKDLMAECAAKGVWEPFERVRGAGCWLDDDEIIIHCGDVVIQGEKQTSHGVCGAYVYPS